MNIRFLLYNALFLLVGCFLLWGCSEDDAPFSGDTIPVSFSTDLAGDFTSSTRVTDDHWDGNEEVGIYMVNGGSTLSSSTSLHTNGKYSIESGGASVSGLKNADGNPIEFPNTSSVNFVAYYPHVPTSAINATDFTFEVDVSKQTKPSDVDLLYYRDQTKTYSKLSPSVPLSFEHKLCKLVVNVYRDANSISQSQLNSLAVGLSGTNTKARFSLANGGLTSFSNNTAIAAYRKSAGDGVSTPAVYELIFLPHGTGSGRNITFSTTGYAGGNYAISSTQAFEAGTQYTCAIKLSSSTPVLLSAGLTPWTGGGFAGNVNNYIKVSESAITAPLTEGSGVFTVITDASANASFLTVTPNSSWLGCTRKSTVNNSNGEYVHTLEYTYDAASVEREGFITVTRTGGPSLMVSVTQSASGGSGSGGSGGSGGGGSSSHGTHVSNCYILEPYLGNTVEVPVSRANEFASGSITGEFTVQVLWWQNVGSSGACPISISKEGTGNSGKILVTSVGLHGNAVVAAIVGGEVKWSWHIWCTNTPTSAIIGERMFMNRNLGACTTLTSSPLSYGFHYEWGRKDPLPHKRVLTSTGGKDVTAKYGAGFTMAQAVAEPLTFFYGTGSGNNWCSDNNCVWYADGKKSIHDPCPIGWRVPIGEDIGESAATWVRAGRRIYYSGILEVRYDGGQYWVCSYENTQGPYSCHDANGIGLYITRTATSIGLSVRCVAE